MTHPDIETSYWAWYMRTWPNHVLASPVPIYAQAREEPPRHDRRGKLSWNDLQVIRISSMSVVGLAKVYGVSPTRVSKIRSMMRRQQSRPSEKQFTISLPRSR